MSIAKRFPVRSSLAVALLLAGAAYPAAALETQPPAEGDAAAPCIAPGEREELLALDQQSFDQDLEGGWRPIAARPECRLAAADLIREYRERAEGSSRGGSASAGESSAPLAGRTAAGEGPGAETASGDPERSGGSATPAQRFGILCWHEAQLRAMEGQNERAAQLMRRSFDDHSDPSWRAYAEATIAFLERDRRRLAKARAELVAIPEPEGWQEAVRQMEKQYGFSPTWPANLDVVNGLIRCYEESYEVAYGAQCRESAPDPP